MRENRLYGSEGGEGDSLSRPLSTKENTGSPSNAIPPQMGGAVPE
jgi:hypothetical protein